MGDAQAVELAQTAHLGILVQLGLLDERNLVTMDMAIPRDRFFGGIVIDNLILFEVMLRSEWSTTGTSNSCSRSKLEQALGGVPACCVNASS